MLRYIFVFLLKLSQLYPQKLKPFLLFSQLTTVFPRILFTPVRDVSVCITFQSFPLWQCNDNFRFSVLRYGGDCLYKDPVVYSKDETTFFTVEEILKINITAPIKGDPHPRQEMSNQMNIH